MSSSTPRTRTVWWKMSAPDRILDCFPSLCQKLSDLVEVWRGYNKNNFACFFYWDTVYMYTTVHCFNLTPNRTSLVHSFTYLWLTVKTAHNSFHTPEARLHINHISHTAVHYSTALHLWQSFRTTPVDHVSGTSWCSSFPTTAGLDRLLFTRAVKTINITETQRLTRHSSVYQSLTDSQNSPHHDGTMSHKHSRQSHITNLGRLTNEQAVKGQCNLCKKRVGTDTDLYTAACVLHLFVVLHLLQTSEINSNFGGNVLWNLWKFEVSLEVLSSQHNSDKHTRTSTRHLYSVKRTCFLSSYTIFHTCGWVAE